MAVEGSQPLKIGTLTASADLSSKQYYFVKISGSGTVTVCSGATDRPIGVLQNKPTSGQPAEIVVVGHTKISCDAALTAGNAIGTSADGQADAKTAGTDTTEYIVGIALRTTGAAGEIGEALINCASANRGA